ncbi:TPA: PTS transporter subunit EIIB [Enterococcus faecium]|nr:PTS transporter subunit EIIB [Enterococcus faecium]
MPILNFLREKNDQYSDLVNNIDELIGGRDNITAVVHCVTRLRF